MSFAVELKHITKRFARVVANQDVSFAVPKGSIHGLCGENGAGKSTIMKILYGMYLPDEGEMLIHGKPVRFKSPSDSIAAGIGMVHQHFMLIHPFTVAENIVLGCEPKKAGVGLDIKSAAGRIRELSKQYELEIDPDAIVGDLSVGEEQRVEILKLLYRSADILIFDEPTAVLTPREARHLFTIFRRLKEQGKTIIIITHKLDEVMEITDNITVMQRGRVTGGKPTAETDKQDIARMMVGRDVLLSVEKGAPKPGATVLEVNHLRMKSKRGTVALDDVTFEIRAGEILGFAGVEGNGQTELLEAVTGLRAPAEGSIRLKGASVAGLGPREMFEAGVAHVPEDRHKRGLVLGFAVRENLILGVHDKAPAGNGVLISQGAVRAEAERHIAEFDIRPTDPDLPVRGLSGGNQQKVVLAREMGKGASLLVAAQPTRGVDVGAIEFIHRRIIEQRDMGRAVLLVSAELSELLGLADRIAVLYKGRIVAVKDAKETNAEELGLLMTGASA